MAIQTFDIPSFDDPRGRLCVIEDQLPFAVERVFWITGADNQQRGGHGHKKTRLAAFAISGRVDMFLDNGAEQCDVRLDSPTKGLIVEPEYWHTMTFHEGANLLVFASHKYDPDDYIFDRPGS